MNPFRRMEVLIAEIGNEYEKTGQNPDEIADHCAHVVADLVPAYPDKKRLFFDLVLQATTAMKLYLEDLQAEEGRKILENLAKGIEPKPSARTVPNPYAVLFREWETFRKECFPGKTSAEIDAVRRIFYGGSLVMFRLIADMLPELGESSGVAFLNCLETELERYRQTL